MEENNYDLIIVGAGGAGIAAGMYAARLGVKTLLLGYSHGSELPIGGVITTTNIVENYPGFKSISGFDLAKKLEDHAREYPLITMKQELVETASKNGNEFTIITKKGEYKSKSVIIATGTKWKTLDVTGSKEFDKKGISYCALCDGAFYRNKVVAIVGGSDSAIKDALVLTEYAKKVYIIYRGEKIHPEPVNLKRIENDSKVEIINNTNIIEFKGEGNLTSVELDKEFNGSTNLKLDGVFIAIGHIMLSEIPEQLSVKLNEKKEVVINHMDSSTNIEGVYAAGDITDKPFKQLITGVGEGVTAAHSVYEYLGKFK